MRPRVPPIGKSVRSCYLMGFDERSGKNFDHRKPWIEVKLKQLDANFGIDLLAFSCLSNHFHLLLRSRPDVVATLDNTQVALRWWQLCPTRKVRLEVDGQWIKVPACQPNRPSSNSILAAGLLSSIRAMDSSSVESDREKD